jgi:septum formation protein
MAMDFILASASPARRRLLQAVGIDPQVRVSYFDEDSIHSPSPAHLAQTLATHKAQRVVDQVTPHGSTLVLGCDSILAINGEIHGKPTGIADAIERWKFMRGRVGEIYTGHTLFLLRPGQPPQQQMRCGMTQVHFAKITDRQITAYVNTGEPLACAGCFALEGKGGLFIEKIEGCHTNVTGLSMPLLRRMMDDFGLDVTDFW